MKSIKVTVDEVCGLTQAFNYMRLPHKEDIDHKIIETDFSTDMPLSKQLIKSGDDHAKHMRMIWIWMRVRAPRYWWQEMATYSIGASYISESTMHTLVKLVRKNMSSRHNLYLAMKARISLTANVTVIENFCTSCIEIFEAEPNSISKQRLYLKAALPEAWLQTRGVNVNYQTLRRIYFARRNHKLPEWQRFLSEVLDQIPYPELITEE